MKILSAHPVRPQLDYDFGRPRKSLTVLEDTQHVAQSNLGVMRSTSGVLGQLRPDEFSFLLSKPFDLLGKAWDHEKPGEGDNAGE